MNLTYKSQVEIAHHTFPESKAKSSELLVLTDELPKDSLLSHKTKWEILTFHKLEPAVFGCLESTLLITNY